MIAVGGSLEIKNNPLLTNLNGLENTSAAGDVLIDGNAVLNSLEALENLNSINGMLSIAGNNSLSSLSGLDNISFVDGFLLVEYNPSLIDLSGLGNLTYTNGGLGIRGNSSLENFAGLENLLSVETGLVIDGNSSLSSLNGIQNLTSIGGILVLEENDILSDIHGLDSIDPGSISNLWILNNPNLSTCNVQSICDYLISPNGTIEIHDNAPGCNSQEEVEDACWSKTNEISEKENSIQIFPNPAKKTIQIINTSKTKIKAITLYGPTGLVILQKKAPVSSIDISMLRAGLYFVEVMLEDGNVRRKLIVE